MANIENKQDVVRWGQNQDGVGSPVDDQDKITISLTLTTKLQCLIRVFVGVIDNIDTEVISLKILGCFE